MNYLCKKLHCIQDTQRESLCSLLTSEFAQHEAHLGHQSEVFVRWVGAGGGGGLLGAMARHRSGGVL